MFTKLTPTVHLDMIYWCHMVVCVLDLHFTPEWLTMVKKKWLSLYYSTHGCYVHQTCTNCSSWPDSLMPHSGLSPWPTFHAWVAMVRKKWLCLFNSTYGCYAHQTYTYCSSWLDLLIPCGGLCLWPTFHASETKTKNGNSGAPVMVPITIMSSLKRIFLSQKFKMLLWLLQLQDITEGEGADWGGIPAFPEGNEEHLDRERREGNPHVKDDHAQSGGGTDEGKDATSEVDQ